MLRSGGEKSKAGRTRDKLILVVVLVVEVG